MAVAPTARRLAVKEKAAAGVAVVASGVLPVGLTVAVIKLVLDGD